MQECVRKPNYVYMFPGSKYQQRIDVGKCVGQCIDNPNSTLGKTPIYIACLFIIVINEFTVFVHVTLRHYLHCMSNILLWKQWYPHLPIYITIECVATRHRSAAFEGPNGK